MWRSVRTKLMLSHLGLMLLAMILLGFYLVRSMDLFYLSNIQGRLRDHAALLTERMAPDLAVGNRESVQTYLNNIRSNLSVRVLVADSDGMIVGSTTPEERYMVGRPGISRGLTKALRTRIEQIHPETDEPTAEIVYLVAPIEWQGQHVGSLRLSYRLRDLDAQIGQMTITILVGLVAAAGVGLLVSLVLAQSLSAPARRLAAGARALSAGDLTYRINPRGEDEIRQAGRAFDGLAERLQRAEWARQQLLGDISHDLHSSITGVSMAVEALQHGAVDDVPLRTLLLDGLGSHTRRLHRLADDLLETARIEAGRLQLRRARVDAGQLLRHVAAEFTAEASQQGVAIELRTSPNLPSLWADRERLAQALGNLVENAIRYTPSGGKVSLSGEANNGEIRLAVGDEGPGIAEGDLPWLFDRYKRFDDERPGRLGFGLAIAKGLAEAHGGRVEVNTARGRGSTFTLILPNSPEPEVALVAEVGSAG